jgi:hypothetical protein
MNTKYNKWFEETAADPTRRRAAISDYSKRRAILFCCALVVTGCAVAMFFTATRYPSSPVIESFAAFMSWIVVIRVSSSLRVLTLIDKLYKDSDEKPVA